MNIKLRDPISALTHFFGAALSIIATFMVLNHQSGNLNPNNINLISSLIFTASMFLLYISSGIYHSLIISQEKLLYFRKLDHSMIYVLIAGSYTPFCLAIKNHEFGFRMFILIWSLAISGIIIKLCFFNAPRAFGTLLYIFLGWMIVFFFKDISNILDTNGMFFLIAGGISYTIGGILYVIKKPNLKFLSFHDIFHIFVLIGTAFHFFSVYYYIL